MLSKHTVDFQTTALSSVCVPNIKRTTHPFELTRNELSWLLCGRYRALFGDDKRGGRGAVAGAGTGPWVPGGTLPRGEGIFYNSFKTDITESKQENQQRTSKPANRQRVG